MSPAVVSSLVAVVVAIAAGLILAFRAAPPGLSMRQPQSSWENALIVLLGIVLISSGVVGCFISLILLALHGYQDDSTIKPYEGLASGVSFIAGALVLIAVGVLFVRSRRRTG